MTSDEQKSFLDGVTDHLSANMKSFCPEDMELPNIVGWAMVIETEDAGKGKWESNRFWLSRFHMPEISVTHADGLLNEGANGDWDGGDAEEA